MASFSKRQLEDYKSHILELVRQDRQDATLLEFVSNDLRADRDFIRRAVARSQKAERYICEYLNEKCSATDNLQEGGVLGFTEEQFDYYRKFASEQVNVQPNIFDL